MPATPDATRRAREKILEFFSQELPNDGLLWNLIPSSPLQDGYVPTCDQALRNAREAFAVKFPCITLSEDVITDEARPDSYKNPKTNRGFFFDTITNIRLFFDLGTEEHLVKFVELYDSGLTAAINFLSTIADAAPEMLKAAAEETNVIKLLIAYANFSDFLDDGPTPKKTDFDLIQNFIDARIKKSSANQETTTARIEDAAAQQSADTLNLGMLIPWARASISRSNIEEYKQKEDELIGNFARANATLTPAEEARVRELFSNAANTSSMRDARPFKTEIEGIFLEKTKVTASDFKEGKDKLDTSSNNDQLVKDKLTEIQTALSDLRKDLGIEARRR